MLYHLALCVCSVAAAHSEDPGGRSGQLDGVSARHQHSNLRPARTISTAVLPQPHQRKGKNAKVKPQFHIKQVERTRNLSASIF